MKRKEVTDLIDRIKETSDSFVWKPEEEVCQELKPLAVEFARKVGVTSLDGKLGLPSKAAAQDEEFTSAGYRNKACEALGEAICAPTPESVALAVKLLISAAKAPR